MARSYNAKNVYTYIYYIVAASAHVIRGASSFYFLFFLNNEGGNVYIYNIMYIIYITDHRQRRKGRRKDEKLVARELGAGDETRRGIFFRARSPCARVYS